MSIYSRYDDAVAALATQNITVVVDTKTITADDAWTDAVRRHGRRVAVASEYGGFWYSPDRFHYYESEHFQGPVSTLWFSFPHEDIAVGLAVADAFTAAGFDVEWDGRPDSAVGVDVSPTES